MLRDPRRSADRPAPFLSAAAGGGLLLFGLAVAGVRPDLSAAQNPAATPAAARAEAQETRPGAKPAAAAQDSSLAAYLPVNAVFAATLRPQVLLNDAAFKPFAGEFEKTFAEKQDPTTSTFRDAGVTPQTVESAAFAVLPRGEGDRGGEPGAFAFRLNKPVDRGVFERRASSKKTTLGGIVYQLAPDAYVTIPDDDAVLLSSDETTLTAMLIGGQVNRASSPWTRIENELGSPALAVMLSTDSVLAQLQKGIQPGTPQAAALMPVMPLLDDAEIAGLGLVLGEKPGLHGYAECGDESAAKRVADTLRALVTLGRNTLRQVKGQAGGSPQEQALTKTFAPIAEALLDSAAIESKGKAVTLDAKAGASSAIALGLILPAVQSAREAARRQQSINNLKQIALAFHGYHEVHGHFPPAVIEENGVTRSWRVEILPFLEQRALYDRYRKDLAWDSPENKQVLEQMPPFFKDPSDDSARTSTSYFTLTGPVPIPATERNPPTAGLPVEEGGKSTVFSDKPVPPGKGPSLMSILDGTSNTLLVVEAKRNVPWTKPEDVPFDPAKAGELAKGLGGNHAGGFIAAFADGSVRFIAEVVDASLFKGLVTPAGGEVIGDLGPIRP